MNTIEGGLNILCENNDQPTATPRYRLLFGRYEQGRSGAQPYKNLVGTDALETYLIETVGLQPEDAKKRIHQVHHERGMVSIPNVMMPESEMSVYEAA